MKVAEKTKHKTSTELAMALWPVVKKQIDEDPEVHPLIMAEALYLVMQLVDGPATAAQVISCSWIRR
ncbi:hypothetical protein [Escherichia albertii]|uniref:Uncharacterized protein n=1 Tax=Escherichia albertii TaxID=208962 RepID=A0ABX5HIB7_ESCAL|nr:hypothetical protein [Escherichia albertii]PSY42141.1 hypothetical protein C7B09_10960 [Escherichia albertii]